MALYHVFLREHNRLVGRLNQTCNNTDCRNEARTLLIAMFQHIICNEYLPLLLGTNTSVKCLNTSTHTYNSTNLPMVSNSFAAAYKLVGASMLRDTVGSNVLVHDVPLTSNTEMTNIVNGMLTNCSLKIGREIPCAYRNNCQYSDIVSILTQDTRYLGLPPYFVWLALTVPIANLPTSIPDLPHHNTSMKIALSNTHQSIFDIEFLTGALSENVVPGAMVGPTLKRLFEDTFNLLQRNDRLYFENAGVFTDEQLAEIRNVTMAQLLCRNVEGLTEVKENAFVHNSSTVQCSSLPDIDFCKYCGVSRNWSAFVTVAVPCVRLQLKYRLCQSTRPLACPCLGSPFEIIPCPSPNSLNILDPVMIMRSKILAQTMGNDTQSIAYYTMGNDYKLVDRMWEIFFMLF
ncbi:heme peroxidase 2 [Octopus bimaculoides]|uniref:Uncharacterized protein n=1 Tax=Octopus bimaculoides TaxID=37653 RepID=A0A0L8GBG9_OCTBM|nr:heme peroxidase 2 [Octopus bimaculoides]|eukprot:XP_014782530.1 PREDICTED: peroxidase mlt-7-like [Octopus bimaculoides]